MSANLQWSSDDRRTALDLHLTHSGERQDDTFLPPTYAPARTTLISGLFPPSTGAEHMRSMVKLPAEFKMFPQFLREANLPKHLDNPTGEEQPAPKATAEPAKGDGKSDGKRSKAAPSEDEDDGEVDLGTTVIGEPGKDPQLDRAIDLLKSGAVSRLAHVEELQATVAENLIFEGLLTLADAGALTPSAA